MRFSEVKATIDQPRVIMAKTNIKGKVVLVTGGTGSFGNAVVERLLGANPKRIIVFSRDEKKQHDMRNFYNSPILKFVIGDVREKESLERIMGGVDYIFHAAALKQVPSCEFFPIEAIKTNVFGAENVIELATKHKVQRLVVLSTDKAVYPINAMGMTKALMEKAMVAGAREISEEGNSATVLCGVRYGNVLYTRASVLPVFVDWIKRNQQILVTDGRMTRFLLPLSHSVDLVLYALTHGQNGDIYVRKAPAATLKILAEAICRIFNFKKHWKEVGIRAGEKMHETLLTQEELLRVIDEGEYYRIPPETQGLDYNQYFIRGKRVDPTKIKPYTSENTKRLNLKETIDLLLTLPEIKQELKNFKKR